MQTGEDHGVSLEAKLAEEDRSTASLEAHNAEVRKKLIDFGLTS